MNTMTMPSPKISQKRQVDTKTPRALAAIVIALMLAPSSIYGISLAINSFQEGAKFAAAPEFDGNRIQGQLYRLSGTVTSGLLTPPGFPELENAMRFTIRSSDGKAESGHTKRIDIGETQVSVEPFTRVVGESRTVTKTTDDGQTVVAEATVIPNAEVVVWGTYEKGVLGGSTLDRLTITTPAKTESTLADIATRGAAKGRILAAVAAIGTLLTLACAIYGWRTLRSSLPA